MRGRSRRRVPLRYLCGPVVMRFLRSFATRILYPAARVGHELGIFELMAWSFCFLLSVQSRRYPAGQADAGVMVALTAGMLAAGPCWVCGDSVKFRSWFKFPQADLSLSL